MECKCSGRESAGDADAFRRKMPNHFSERRILAAHLRQIGHAKPIEGHHTLLLGHPACLLDERRAPAGLSACAKGKF